jgi:hypothetical protein
VLAELGLRVFIRQPIEVREEVDLILGGHLFGFAAASASRPGKPVGGPGAAIGIPNPSTTISAVGTQGQYVRIQLMGTGYLSLAEVLVFGPYQQEEKRKWACGPQ